MGARLTSVDPVPASIVVLIRPSAARFEVLLMQRHPDIAFMGGAHLFPGGRVDDADREGGTDPHAAAAVRELLEEAGVQISLDVLTPCARWITPEGERKRFDTQFFVAEAPAGQTAAHDGVETVGSAWLDPADAVDRARRGAIILPPPTWTTLRRLEGLRSVEEVLAWAARQPTAPIRPIIMRAGGSTRLYLPGDPEHPAAAVADPPAETRFELQDGRWQPCMSV